ncbi:hypothetical protein NM208_g8842 [Fusarium decemcellulare]|uniref:Uncharacterized protein n=1 Tax=Fusarium decemcellulare TaxID=57161 RepID=A0ACC1S3U1_9HYPO|nr:hypothetical protein NM208_g8842 [Fusarium decemcellulare]
MAKRRRLQESNTSTFTRDETPDASQHYFQKVSQTKERGLGIAFDSKDIGATAVAMPDSSTGPVCFGTLVSLTARTTLESDDKQSCQFGSSLRLESDGKLHAMHSEVSCGTLGARDTQLLNLLSREGIESELLWMPGQPSGGNYAEGRTGVWATLYGPRDLASDLCDMFQKLGLYLQDPMYARRDAAYFNPQRFFNDPDARTYDFRVASSQPEPNVTFKDEQVAIADVLDKLVAESDVHETRGSSYLKTDLKSHQMQGLTFMIHREMGWRLHHKDQDMWSQVSDEFGHVMYINNVDGSSHCQLPPGFRGGLLADPMGLGKTLSMISLIAHDKVIREESSTQHLCSQNFTWRRHHKDHRIRESSEVGLYDIVLTTYSTLAKEWQSQEQGSVVFSHNWHRIILDEAHEIKDLSTTKSKATCALRADCRWAVTGTPIQNRLSELFSLIHFLQASPYCKKKYFNDGITKPWRDGDERGYQALVKLLGYIMLRRPKNSITLPERQDHRRLLNFSAQEQEAYDISKQKVIDCLEDAVSASRPQGYRNALEKINALREICELGCMSKDIFNAKYDDG